MPFSVICVLFWLSLRPRVRASSRFEPGDYRSHRPNWSEHQQPQKVLMLAETIPQSAFDSINRSLLKRMRELTAGATSKRLQSR